jgi:FKBP-type peptidyl-prolyl cis-trans isomerase
MKKLVFPLLFIILGALVSMCGSTYQEPCYNKYSAIQEAQDQIDIQAFIERKEMTGVIKTASGLNYYIYEKGDGITPRATSVIRANYRGSFINDESGKAFEEAGYNPEFVLNKTIQGWIEGLQLIAEGGRIRLMIPSHLAYGNCGSGEIPPNTPIVFDITLVSVTKY